MIQKQSYIYSKKKKRGPVVRTYISYSFIHRCTYDIILYNTPVCITVYRYSPYVYEANDMQDIIHMYVRGSEVQPHVQNEKWKIYRVLRNSKYEVIRIVLDHSASFEKYKNTKYRQLRAAYSCCSYIWYVPVLPRYRQRDDWFLLQVPEHALNEHRKGWWVFSMNGGYI